ncbi:MAG: hypothetical protein AAF570_00875 [Bacteroidota bacterium]
MIIFNLLLTAFLVGFNPEWLQLLPDNSDFNYYVGVGILGFLFLEFAGLYYKSRWIFSFSEALHRKVPWYISNTFLPRVIVSGIFATLAFQAMGALEISDFFLLPIILYATMKEFWVRSVLLATEKDKNPRPAAFKVWMGEIMIFLFICVGYMAVWKYFLLENPRVKYMVLSPINYGFVVAAFLVMLYCLLMPYFWEAHLGSRTKRQRVLNYLSILLPTGGLIAQLYLMGFVR